VDTRSIIVAVASPPGASLRGVVRLSGAGCRELVAELAAVTEAATVAAPALGGGATLARGIHIARLRAPAPACACLVAVMPGPGSATGEDCVEVHVVGNPHLLERVCAAAVEAGRGACRRALPGEFSARAVLNGRLTLAEAERVAGAVAAATDAQLAAANALRANAAGLHTHAAADAVTTLLALVEAGIDFTDQEDVSAIAPAELARQAGALAERLDALVAESAGAEAAIAAPLVVLAGPPNAGKSSLFNALLGRERAVASPEAGTTRDVLREPLALPDGSTALLADAPGLDRSVSALDVLMQQHAEAALAEADVVLWCAPVTESEGQDGGDASAVASSASPPPPGLRATVVRVATMSDRAPTTLGQRAIRTSALTGTGLDDLRREIAGAVGNRSSVGAGERLMLGAAQRELLGLATSALREAVALCETASVGARAMPSAELVAASLREALDRLGEVAGAVPPDDVLGRLFARFCIGK
jgi:tRNA modification GTPase